MAALVRSSALLQLKKVYPLLPREVRLISTSKKNSETATVAPTTTNEPVHNFEKPDPKNWVSYGFDYNDKKEDRHYTHATFFFSITLVFIFGGTVWAYLPDINLRNWAVRQAFLEIRRREAEGLPLVDRNYIDPAQMKLPSEEELGETRLII